MATGRTRPRKPARSTPSVAAMFPQTPTGRRAEGSGEWNGDVRALADRPDVAPRRDTWTRAWGRDLITGRSDDAPAPWYTRLAVAVAGVLTIWWFAPTAIAVVVVIAGAVVAFLAAWACVALGCAFLAALLSWLVSGRWPGGAGPR